MAVLHIHVDGQLPSLALASTAAAQGDTMYLNGFPDLPDDSEAAALQPTLSDGQITAIKPNRTGLQLLQHNATTSPGASGAPALNQAGEVIGILVSGAVDSEGSSLGENYLMPLDSVRRASPTRGPVPWTLILIAGGALLLVLASGAFGYWLSRRRHIRVAVQTVGNGVENERNPDTSADTSADVGERLAPGRDNREMSAGQSQPAEGGPS